MRKILKLVFIVLFMLGSSIIAKPNSFNAYLAAKAPVVDGLGSDSCWSFEKWYDIKYDWANGTKIIKNTDFTGKFKAVWTPDRLYILAVITDDVLRDDRENPTSEYWNDDCLEIFIDENHRNDMHEAGDDAFNAFAYHIAAVPRDESGNETTFDDLNGIHNVVDFGVIPGGQLFNNHVNAMVTQNGNVYTWEIEILIFNDTYIEDAENETVTLNANKIMGFAMAYCDNDNGTREDFIGTEPDHNDYDGAQKPCYQYTDAFGALTLNDSVSNKLSPVTNSVSRKIEVADIFIWPTQGADILYFKHGKPGIYDTKISVFNLSGQLLMHERRSDNEGTISLSQLKSGIYFLEMRDSGKRYVQKIIKR